MKKELVTIQYFCDACNEQIPDEGKGELFFVRYKGGMAHLCSNCYHSLMLIARFLISTCGQDIRLVIVQRSNNLQSTVGIPNIQYGREWGESED